MGRRTPKKTQRRKARKGTKSKTPITDAARRRAAKAGRTGQDKVDFEACLDIAEHAERLGNPPMFFNSDPQANQIDLNDMGIMVHKKGTRRRCALWARNDPEMGHTVDFDGDQILKLKKDQLVEILCQEDMEGLDFLLTVNNEDETLILVGQCKGINLFDYDVERLKALKKGNGRDWDLNAASDMEITTGNGVEQAINATNIGE